MSRVCWVALGAVTALGIASCGDDDGGNDGGGGQGADGSGAAGGSLPTCTDCTPVGPMTYGLPSPTGATLWTTTPMDKVLREAAPPTDGDGAIRIYAAKNEFEPFQLVVHPEGSADVRIDFSGFSGPSTIDRVEIRKVGYVRIDQPSDPAAIASGFIPDPLEPWAFGGEETLAADDNQPYWITVYVPPGAAAGDYSGTLTVSVDGQSSDVPVELHVYDFELPMDVGFDGRWNTSMQALGGGESLEAVEEIKDFFYEHRLTPLGVAWPAGLNYNGGIEYDCNGNFIDGSGPYDFATLGVKYIDGEGWNGVGFPSFQVMQFVDNSTPRPAEFCGVSRGPDHFGTAAYNAKWAELLSAIDSYVVSRGWQDKAFYYVQNEPQGQADYDVAAFLADLTKSAAPNLRIAVSEEPKPEIAEHPSANGSSYDIWFADLSHFEPTYSASRQALGEEAWWYFLYGDLPPHFNPITIDHNGIESRIGHWAAYKYRIAGFTYYSVTGWGDDPYNNPRPQGTNQNGDGFLLYPPVGGQLVTSIRWELLREGQEDYEYFRLAAGGSVPNAPGSAVGCDATVESAVSSPTSFTKDNSAFLHVRNELGFFLEGQRDGCPELDSTLPGAHPRAPYYINFQDPNGEPSQSPLMVNGQEWLKIGWSAYDGEVGYGWSGPYIGDDSIMLYQYLGGAAVDELQKSIIYNDYGRTDTFNWDIEGGRYEVTVSVGWSDNSYDAHRVVVEGDVLFDSVATTPGQPYLVDSRTVDITDGNVTLEVGQQDQYTMLNWVSIVPVD